MPGGRRREQLPDTLLYRYNQCALFETGFGVNFSQKHYEFQRRVVGGYARYDGKLQYAH